MIIGASDTGKSTLARYLFQQSCARGIRAAYLDADVGQGVLGPPTTMTVALASRPDDDRFPPRGPRATFFVGANTPRGHMLPTVIGALRLQDKASALGAEAILVDTTGLVERREGGKALKQWKIELLAPTVVVGLQRHRELEPILWPLRLDGRVRSIDLPVSPLVVERSRETRIAWRRRRWACYLEGAPSHSVSLRHTAIYDLDRLAVGTVLAFQDAEGFVLGLGVVEQLDRLEGTAMVRSPLSSLQQAESVRLGATRWHLTEQREM
jgi:polynucleotide 5'-hydroxyl-kinase GRC3/NOL9